MEEEDSKPQDKRPLWEILEENRRLADDEWEENKKKSFASRFLLQDDDMKYIASLKEKEMQKQQEIESENQKALKEFRQAAATVGTTEEPKLTSKRPLKPKKSELEDVVIVKKRKGDKDEKDSKDAASKDTPSKDTKNPPKDTQKASALSLLAEYSDDE